MTAIDPARHRAFSPGRVAAIAGNTLTELVRLKVFYFLLFFGLVIIGSSAFLLQFSFQEEFQVLKDVSLGAMTLFTSLLAIAATALLLPKDMEDRTLYTILAKPVPRGEYLLGKLVGVLLLLALSMALMGVVFALVLQVRQHGVLAGIAAQMQGQPADQIAAAQAGVRAAAWSPHLFEAMILVYFKAALLAALTLFVSTFATSSIFTMIIVVAVYFIGHLQSVAREYWLAGGDTAWWTKGFLAVVSLVFPDLGLFNLADDLVAGNVIAFGLFLRTCGLGALYVAVYTLLAWFVFAGKEL